MDITKRLFSANKRAMIRVTYDHKLTQPACLFGSYTEEKAFELIEFTLETCKQLGLEDYQRENP